MSHEHLLGTAHLAVAILAIGVGGLVAVARKGTGRHRVLGRIYVLAMVAVNVTALAIYELFGGFGPFHAAAIFSLVTVIAGVVPVRTRTPFWLPRHAWWMGGSYVGLLAAAVSEITTRYLEWDFGLTVALSSGLVLAAGLTFMALRLPPVLQRLSTSSGRVRSRPPVGGA